MSEPEGEALICGFWGDGDAPAGLAWRLAGSQGGLAGSRDEARAAEAQIDAGPAGLTVRLEPADGPALEVELAPRGETALGTPDGGPAAAGPRAAVCDASVRSGEGGKTAGCRGFVLRWAAEPAAGAQLFRALAVPAADGGLVLLTARREPGGADHAAEATAAWLLGSGGDASAFDEALLSTQYDGEGRQTRLGLELWPAEAEAPPMRASATALGVSTAGGTAAALMRSSAEGAEGVGGYLIWRS
jgi:hypothetical protein